VIPVWEMMVQQMSANQTLVTKLCAHLRESPKSSLPIARGEPLLSLGSHIQSPIAKQLSLLLGVDLPHDLHDQSLHARPPTQWMLLKITLQAQLDQFHQPVEICGWVGWTQDLIVAVVVLGQKL